VKKDQIPLLKESCFHLLKHAWNKKYTLLNLPIIFFPDHSNNTCKVSIEGDRALGSLLLLEEYEVTFAYLLGPR
jgi:hypothetical protein